MGRRSHLSARVPPAEEIATPDGWARMLDRAPILRVEAGLQSRVVIRRWQDTHPDVRQPPLDQNYIVLHLGGPKRVRRRGADGERVVEMDQGAVSIVSAGAAYQWRTEGAIDYAHIYVPSERLTLAAVELFSRDEPQIRLIDVVGARDDLLSQLFQALLAEVDHDADGLYVDALHNAFLGRLLAGHSNLAAAPRAVRAAIAPHRLAAVTGYVEAHLSEDIILRDLAAVAGLSPFHFARTFALTTGYTPHAYVMIRRLEAAKRLLRDSVMSIDVIARQCGFSSASHFSTRFRRATGATPTAFRRGR
ncbi:MAG: AraC family transcriptional regulator [Caulobacteraceae bacterium]